MTAFSKATIEAFRVQFNAPARRSLSVITRRYEMLCFDPKTKAFVPGRAVREVVLDGGRLLIDGHEIANPRFGPDFVAFSATSETMQASGVLNFPAGAQTVIGSVYIGPVGATPAAIQLVGQAPVARYDLQMGSTGAAPPDGQEFPQWRPAAPDAWTKIVSFEQSYSFTPGGIQQSVFKLADQDISNWASPMLDPTTGNLIVSIDIPQDLLADLVAQLGKNAPCALKFEISATGETLDGIGYKILSDGQGGYAQSAEAYPVKGQWVQGSTLKTAPLARSAASAFRTPTNGALKLDRLYSMQVDPKLLQVDQFNALVENMKWALLQDPEQKHLLAFFGETPPDPPNEMQAIIRKDLEFLTQRMAVAYLAGPINAMTGDGGPTTHLTDAQKLNLDFYLRAGLLKEPGFTRQSNAVFLSAYKQAAIGLSDYISDQNANTVNGQVDPAHDWAAMLYGELTRPEKMNMVYNGVLGKSGTSQMNRHSAQLMALDPSGKYASRYHKLFLTRAMAQAIPNLKLTDKAAVVTWLEPVLTAIVKMYGPNGTHTPPDDFPIDLKEVAEEIDEAASKANGAAALATELAELVLAMSVQNQKGSTSFWNTLRNIQSAWAKAGYRFARAIYVIAIAGGLISAIISFLNWNGMTSERKGEAVVSAVDSSAKIVKSIKDIAIGDWNFTKAQALDDATSTDGNFDIDYVSFEEIKEGTQELAKVAGGANNIATDSTRFGELFETMDDVVSVIALGAAIVLAVLSTITFISDIISGAPISQEILDGIIMAANIAVAIVALVMYFVEGVSQCVPVLGAIMAVIGVIATLIELLLPKPKPETPGEKFMEEDLLPAMSPIDGWILACPPNWATDQPVPTPNPYSKAAAAF